MHKRLHLPFHSVKATHMQCKMSSLKCIPIIFRNFEERKKNLVFDDKRNDCTVRKILMPFKNKNYSITYFDFDNLSKYGHMYHV